MTRINKQLSAEATHFLYSNNCFRLSLSHHRDWNQQDRPQELQCPERHHSCGRRPCSSCGRTALRHDDYPLEARAETSAVSPYTTNGTVSTPPSSYESFSSSATSTRGRHSGASRRSWSTFRTGRCRGATGPCTRSSVFKPK